MAPKVITNEDRVKIRCILNKDRFLRQHNNSEESKKIIQAFEESGLLHVVTFDYIKEFKRELHNFI